MGKMEQIDTPPFTPETLARRWGVSASSIRKKCAAGEMQHFRYGSLYRIPAHVVKEIETCQTSASEGCAVGSVSTGSMPAASELGISLRHAPERKRKLKQ